MKILPWFFALFAGFLLPLAFAPVCIFPLTVISLLILLLVWERASSTKALGLGYLFGLGLFGGGASWIFISINVYGNTNVFIAGLITALFVMILALFPAVNGYILNRAFPKPTVLRTLIAFPSIWSLLEWVRSWFCTGFPWLLLGHSQVNSPLHGYAPIVGVYGTSFLVALSAGLLFTIIKNQKRLISIILFVVIWVGGFALSNVQWTTASSNPFNVTLIQGNIPQSTKWSKDQALKSLELYQSLSQQHWQSQLIVWPEGAISLMPADALNYLDNLDKTADKNHAAIIAGIPIPEGSDSEDNYYNGIIVLGDGSGHYFKRHLVPFGEYVPLDSMLRGLIGFFNLPMSNFIPGPMHQDLLETDQVKIAPYICYEIAYPEILRSNLPEANLLVTISDDTWFDGSAAMYQHRQIAQFAALSTGRYMLMATNSGQTSVINPQGRVIAVAPVGEVATLTGDVYSMEGATPWVKLGDTPILLLFGLLLLLCLYNERKK